MPYVAYCYIVAKISLHRRPKSESALFYSFQGRFGKRHENLSDT